jgi:hypothetical protein
MFRESIETAAKTTVQDYSVIVKEIWTGRVIQVAGKYGENAPTVAVCCNACRTCLTTNLIGLATAGVMAASYGVARFARRLVRPD